MIIVDHEVLKGVTWESIAPGGTLHMNKEAAQAALSQLQERLRSNNTELRSTTCVFWAADEHGNPNKGKGPLLVYLADSLDGEHFNGIPVSAYIPPLAARTDHISGSAG
jgi:hypothetical protein